MCFSVPPAQRESLPVRIFSSPFFSSGKRQKASPPECWISELYLAVRLWISVLTVSENELFRFCLSLLSLHLRASAFLLPPSLPFLSAAFSFTLISQCIVFVSFSARLLSWLFVSTSVSHLSLPQSSSSGLFLIPSFLPPPPSSLGPVSPFSLSPGRSLSALLEPFVLPSSVT